MASLQEAFEHHLVNNVRHTESQQTGVEVMLLIIKHVQNVKEIIL